METKILEVRDRATFIPVIATHYIAENFEQSKLLKAAGFVDGTNVILQRLEGGQANYDQYNWGDRTMANAHDYIIKHFDELSDGDVVDVEFILGETKVKKEPQ